ncbi:PTS glucose transporter subunit IIA [Lacticaseibacillus baoqingensis]|uniref:PTS glucose transporter subunit IIA n=1 Tax=Lacticaseibacillus baoqingensis TaxID=2486013 RepID=A0ABW4E8C8_9LACO|nr:PTS glucose transporter subunit IIA [Lacticaseibacillus baoqingensis]
MFKLFNKAKTENFVAPATGTLVPITAVEDPVFSEKTMGDGYAVEPTDDTIVAPVAGTVQAIFPTKHALTILTAQGLEVILHIGLDTVELDGAPFTVQAVEGQSVTAGTPLVTMNRAAVIAGGKQTTVVVVITNMEKLQALPAINDQAITAGDAVATVALQK